MYKRPQEYLQELKDRIDELKAELAEIEPIYEALINVGIKTENIVKPTLEQQKIFPQKELTPSEKIAEAQRERHKRDRDAKVPEIVKCLKEHGPSSLASIARELHMTSGAIKKIVKENSQTFIKNRNQLWELK
mgnify:FL=1